MKKSQKRTIKKGKLKKRDNRSKNKNKKKNKRSKRKSIQKGGAGLLPAIGVGLVATSIAAAAYKGFRLVNKIKDKTYLLRLLNRDYIEYSPKVVITETPEFIKYYLQCVSTYEFFQILLSRPEYLKSRTLQHIIKDASLNEKRSKSELKSEYGDEFSDVDKIITALHSKENSDIQDNLSLKPGLIETSKNKYISDLKNLLLLTARIPGANLEEDTNSIEKINPYITVNSFRWMDVIIKGNYDEYFDSSVNEILDERNISQSLDKQEKERIQNIIEQLSDNRNFRSAIRKKMLECSSKPRGYLDFVSSTISWDSQKKCLSCPEQDCLIYIYDFYYDFLKENISDLPIVDKLYALMICEARICVLSKCLALEAIRVQDKNDKNVRKLIHQIYRADIDSPFDKINESNMFSDKLFQKGGGAEINDDNITQGDIEAFMNEDQSMKQPSMEPAAMEPAIMEPTGMEPAGMEPTGMEPTGMQPTGMQPTGMEPAGMEPAGMEPAGMEQPTGIEPASTEPASMEQTGMEQNNENDISNISTMAEPAETEQNDEIRIEDLNQVDENSLLNNNETIKPTSEIELQSEEQKNNSEKTSNDENLEDFIKTQLEIFMSKDDEIIKLFLQKLDLSIEDKDNLDKIYDEYIQYKVINEMTIKELIQKLFLDSSEYIDNLTILYKFIKRDGIILFDIFTTDKLREDNILFKTSDLFDDEKLALYIKSLNGSEEMKALSFLLLRMSDNPQLDETDKCLSNPEIENLLFIIDDNSDNLENIIKHVFSLLTESNKDNLLKRIATIYNSISLEKRKTIDRVDVMYHNVSVNKEFFNIPDYSIKTKNKSLNKSREDRNPLCIQKEKEFLNKVHSKQPIIINSATLHSLERCAVRNNTPDEDEDQDKNEDIPKPPEIDMPDENMKLLDETKNEDIPKPPEIDMPDENLNINTTDQTSMEPASMEPTNMEPTGMEPTNMETSGMETSGMETSGMENSGMENSVMETSGMETSGMETSGMEQTGMETSGMETSGMETSGMETSNMETSNMETSNMEPSNMEPTGMEPSNMEPTGMEPTGMEPTGMEPTGMGQMGMEPTGMGQMGMEENKIELPKPLSGISQDGLTEEGLPKPVTV